MEIGRRRRDIPQARHAQDLRQGRGNLVKDAMPLVQVAADIHQCVTAAGDLNINNSTGVTLSASTTSSGTLALNNGSLTLGTFDLTPTTITGVSTSNYIKTNSTGKLIRTVLGQHG